MNDEPIFKTIGQLLYHAYAMEVIETSIRGGTAIVIEDLMERRYGRRSVETEVNPNRLNLAGLTRQEFGGQCAAIRNTIESHENVTRLHDTERNCILARFGYQTTRARGVIGLRDYFESLCTTRNRDAIGALIWAIYAPARPKKKRRQGKDTADWSLRLIERDYAVGKNTLHRDQQLLRKLCNTHELQAQHRLESYFVRKGLVVDPSKEGQQS